MATLATIDVGRKEGDAVSLLRRAGARLIQRGLGRGLLPYQVVSSSIQPFGRNRREPKTVRISLNGYLFLKLGFTSAQQ